MSALGQKRTLAVQQRMSALTPKADMCGANSNVCFGPDIALFDHLVGLRKQRRWHCYAQCFSRLKIDHQLVLGRRLRRKVGGLLHNGMSALPPKADMCSARADVC